jgi:hypothetical protein
MEFLKFLMKLLQLLLEYRCITHDIFILKWQSALGAKIFWSAPPLKILDPVIQPDAPPLYILDPILWSDQPNILCI